MSLESRIAWAIDQASQTDVLSSDSLATIAKRYTVSQWRRNTIAKVVAVGAVTGAPGGLAGGILSALDIAYLFGAAGRGCYGIGHILGRDVEREEDLRLILAVWCGAAESVAGVTAGKIAIKVAGKAALPTVAGFASTVLAKSAIKGGGKMSAKLLPQIAGKLAGQFAGKAGAAFVPLLGGLVSGAISYWVANSLMNAAEQYYRHDYVQFTGDISATGLGVELATDAALSG